MQFLYPGFLWALAALAIPIIVHLFYFRRFKKVSFTNVRLLKEIKEETSSRNKLKDLLILLSRLLALAFLIAAFAQPFLPRGEDVKTGSNAVSVFVDNSFSMNALYDQTPILDVAKEKARQVVRAYSESDNFQILTHDFEGRHQRMVSRENAIELIDEIVLTPAVKEISTILNRQQQVLAREEGNKIRYVLSDFQKSILSEEVIADTLIETNFVPIQSIQESNIAIDSAWIESDVAFIGQSNKLIVQIKNHGDETADKVRLSIVKDGQEKPEGQLTIAPKSTIIDTITLSILTPGWHTAQIKISDYPVQFDDNYWISFYVDEILDVLVINEGNNNRYLQALFSSLPNFRLQTNTANRINYGELNNYKLIIIHGLSDISSGMVSSFTSYVEDGGKILFFPGIQMNQQNINSFLTALNGNNFQEIIEADKTVTQINTDEFVFNDVFNNTTRNITLPSVSFSYRLTNFQNRPEEKILSFRDGLPFLVKYTKGNGLSYICTSPLASDYNNLVLNAEIFVPMIYKMAIAKATADPLSYTIGNNAPIELKKDKNISEVAYAINGPAEFIPSQLNLGNRVILTDNDQVRVAGIYTLSKDKALIKKLAFNYDRKESDMTISDIDNMDLPFNIISENLTADFTSVISEKDKGVVLWKWCLILALIFFLVETLLLRFWKK